MRLSDGYLHEYLLQSAANAQYDNIHDITVFQRVRQEHVTERAGWTFDEGYARQGGDLRKWAGAGKRYRSYRVLHPAGRPVYWDTHCQGDSFVPGSYNSSSK